MPAFPEQLPFNLGATLASFAGGCQITLSVCAARESHVGLCVRGWSYWVGKIALKAVWLSCCMNTELHSAAAPSAQGRHWSRTTLGRLEDGTRSELWRKTARVQGRGLFQLFHSQKALSLLGKTNVFFCGFVFLFIQYMNSEWLLSLLEVYSFFLSNSVWLLKGWTFHKRQAERWARLVACLISRIWTGA